MRLNIGVSTIIPASPIRSPFPKHFHVYLKIRSLDKANSMREPGDVSWQIVIPAKRARDLEDRHFHFVGMKC